MQEKATKNLRTIMINQLLLRAMRPVQSRHAV